MTGRTGLAEGLTRALGDELNLLGGARLTRLLATLRPAQQIANGIADANSANGVAITRAGGADFGTVGQAGTPVAGQRFRCLSGPATNQSALIAGVVGNPVTQMNLVGDGVSALFSAATWEVVAAADSTASVEATLGWPLAGQIYIERVRYRYDHATSMQPGPPIVDATFEGLRPFRHLPLNGRIVCVAGAALVDGETVTIDDGQGSPTSVLVLEFKKSASAPPTQLAYVPVRVTDASTATAVRDAVIAALAGRPAGQHLQITAAAGGTGGGGVTVLLAHEIPGGTGPIHCTTTVANAGFRVDGPRGVEVQHDPLAEILDYDQSFSAFDLERRSFLAAHALGEDLDVVGALLGVPRPPSLEDDEVYRRLVVAQAYAPRGTLWSLELALTAVLGRGGYELFEAGIQPTPGLPAGRRRSRVYLRRTNQSETALEGRTFLDGAVLRPIAGISPTTAVLTETPLRVASARLAPEPGPRTVASGADSVSSGIPNTSGELAVSVDVQPTGTLPGDIFMLTKNRRAGVLGTVQTFQAPTNLTLAPIRGAELHMPADFPLPPGAGVPAGQAFPFKSPWKIVRPLSNWRHYRPSEESTIEYDGGALKQTWIWSGSGGPGDETTRVVRSNDATQGPYLAITPDGIGGTAFYTHLCRIQPESEATFSVQGMAIFGTVSALDGRQATFQIHDGERRLAVGVFDFAAGVRLVKFIDAGGVAVSTPGWDGGRIDTGVVADRFKTFTIKKAGRDVVELYEDGRLVQRAAYTAFSAWTDRQLIVGALAGAAELRLKQADWSMSTPIDFWNTRVLDGTTIGPNIVTSGNGVFAAGDVGRKVRIADFNRVSVRGGNARGEWQITTVTDPNTAVVTGVSRPGVRVLRGESPQPIASNPSGAQSNDGVNVTLLFAGSIALGILPGRRMRFRVPSTGRSALIVSVSPAAPQATQTLVLEAPGVGALTSKDWEVIAEPNKRRVAVPADPRAFAFPDNVGSSLLIESGPNASLTPYGIARYLDPLSWRDLADRYFRYMNPIFGNLGALPTAGFLGATVHARDLELLEWTNVVELDRDLPAPADDTEGRFRLVPAFITDAGPVPYEIVDRGTASGVNLTLPANIPGAAVGDIVEVEYSRFLSAEAVGSAEQNARSPGGNYAFYPFYLSDNWGYIRDVVRASLAAGYVADLDSLVRDDAGLHILED